MKKRWMVSLMAVAMAVSMGSVRQKFGGGTEMQAAARRRDHGSGSGGQRGDTDR